MTRRSVPDWVTELVRVDVRATAGYHVADADGLVKLDAMENPFALPPALRADLAQRLAAVELNRYPDPQAQALTGRLRQAFGVDPRWRILLGNGSDEIIQILIAALATPEHGVLAPAPTFVMFRLIAQWLRVPFHEVSLAADFSLDSRYARDARGGARPPAAGGVSRLSEQPDREYFRARRLVYADRVLRGAGGDRRGLPAVRLA